MNRYVPSRETFGRGRWKIIGHEKIPADFEFPTFFWGLVGKYGLYTLVRGDEADYVPKVEAMKHEPAILFGPERIEEALLKKSFNAGPKLRHAKSECLEGITTLASACLRSWAFRRHEMHRRIH